MVRTCGNDREQRTEHMATKKRTHLPGFDASPVTLQGSRVRLEPLELRHAAGLFEAGRSSSIWQYLPVAGFREVQDAIAWISQARKEMEQGSRIAFAIVESASGRTAGSTSYLDIQPSHRTIEIGWTWLGARFQRSFVNTECKCLLLKHAFEQLDAIRVQFKTDRCNARSRLAIERIGAVFEGIHRNHMILPDGRIRDSAFYSITDAEWRDGIEAYVGELMNHGGAPERQPKITN